MADRLSLAVRFMIARRRGTCAHCGNAITAGMLIARLTGPRAWCHDTCLRALREALTEED